MSIALKHHIGSVDLFIELFSNLETKPEEKVQSLLNSEEYAEIIDLIRMNFEITQEKYKELFFTAYCSVNNNEVTEGDHIYKTLIISAIRDGLTNLNSLLEDTNRLIEVIERKEFIKKALYFLPQINGEITVTIVYGVFMKNAMVENNKIYLDISFANLLSDQELNDLLAHELHHYLKDYCEITQTPCLTDSALSRFMRMLENEGIANLCNFESLDRIYTVLQVNSGISMRESLTFVKDYLLEFFDFIMNQAPVSYEVEFVHTLKYIPMSYYMANKILEVKGIEDLKGLVGHPLEFLKAYLQCGDDCVYGYTSSAVLLEINNLLA